MPGECRTFAEAAPRLAAHGYEPIPITLPSERWAGKDAGKRPAIEAWQEGCSDLAAAVRAHGHRGVGLLTRRTPALDIDVRDAALVRELYHLAREILGPGPVRIGQRPKALLPYRAEQPFPKAKVQYALAGEDPTAPGYQWHGIEVLGAGQQYVSYGVHPATGRAYIWYRGEPLTLAAYDLVPITGELVRGYFAAADELLIARGAVPRAACRDREKGGKPPPSAAPRRVRTRSEAEALAVALRSIPVDQLSYDGWISVGMALKGAMGDAGWPLFRWWSAQHPANREQDSERKWRSFKPTRIGAGTIFHMAKLYGRL